jgi:antitoxin component of MazEF toxin-antitoxin module
MKTEIGLHRTQKMGGALYVLLPSWWARKNKVEHGDELVIGMNGQQPANKLAGL